MEQRTQNNSHSNNRGFAMLFAVLVSSVLLSIGISIFNLTVKELTLSSSGRESQFAFYAADTGAECALYWDINGVAVFATSSYDNTSIKSPPDPSCVDRPGVPQLINLTPVLGSLTDSNAETTFQLDIPNINPITLAPENYCAIVTVTKNAPNRYGLIKTSIDSRGYNTPCGNTASYRVERALQITYTAI